MYQESPCKVLLGCSVQLNFGDQIRRIVSYTEKKNGKTYNIRNIVFSLRCRRSCLFKAKFVWEKDWGEEKRFGWGGGGGIEAFPRPSPTPSINLACKRTGTPTMQAILYYFQKGEPNA